MFRAQQNAFDDVVAKATDENLTSENWEYIMDTCDKVNGEDNGGKDVCASMIKRMAHRNANVQLYTLELANALSQNCGIKMHVELASRAFTDALLRLANDRNTHQQVKAKILERMAEWAEMFRKDPSLGIMGDQYQKLKSQNPNLHPPSAPQKSRLTDVDRQKEEEELQMALKLSVQAAAEPVKSVTDTAEIGTSQTATATPQAVPSGTTAATVSRVRALYDFTPSEPGELQFKKGDVIAVLESVFKDWWKGSLKGQTGIFPLNYVEKLADPTTEELQREAMMESEVFSEIKNVEKLLTLLSTSNSTELNVEDNEEITKLYHQTLSIRPKLIELIGKYSQKKDDFTQLNEKFIKARRDYESLLESSMAHPPPQQYGGYGRQPQPGGYGGYSSGYPVQNAQQHVPAQQDPQRYYTPAPQQQPPRNGPAPFYVMGQPGQGQSEQQVQQPYPSADPTPRIAANSKPAHLRSTSANQATSPPPQQYSALPSHQQYSMQPQTGHRPQSTYANPQELSAYDSPLPSSSQAQQQYQAQTANDRESVYSRDDPYSATATAPPAQLGNAQQYTAYVPGGHQPEHAPPAAPNDSGYKPYVRPGSSAGAGSGAGTGDSAPPASDAAADFYRSAAY